MVTTAYDGSLKFDTKIDTNGFAKGANTIKSQASGLKSMLGGLGKAMFAAFSVAAIVSFGKQAIDTASDLQEVQNVVDTAFGSMAYKMEDFAKNSIQSFGISELAAKQTGSTFMAMSRGMGIAMGTSSDMAVSLTGLSADMSSFYNVSQDVASTALKSIFTGETETLKQFGIVMTQANLQAFAYSKGIKQNVSDMDQASITQLRYQYVMQQTSLAQGDFTKTSGSWANQTRVLSEQWKQFLGILGQGLLQVLTPVIRFLNFALSQLIAFASQVGNILSSVFNLGNATGTVAKNTSAISTGSEDAATGLKDMGKATKKAAKDASGGVAGFDKLNNTTESIADNSSDAANALSGMGGVGGTYAVGVDTSKAENGLTESTKKIKEALSGFVGWISTNFAPIFAKVWTDLQPGIETFKDTVAGMFSDMQTLAKPLIDYFTGSFVPYLQQVFSTMGTIIVGLFDTFNKVFSDIWSIVVFPIMENFISVILPMITDFGTQMWATLQTVFESIKTIFDMIWSDAIAPALKIATGIWLDFVNIIAEFWKKWGDPIFKNIRKAWQTTTDLFVTLWKTTLKPVWDTFMGVVDKLWKDHLKPLVANFMDFVGEFVNGALEIYNKFIVPVVKWFVEKLGPPIATIISGMITNIGDFVGGIVDAVSGIMTALKGIIQFIVGVFTGDWKKAWTGIKNIFKGIFDALVGIVKTPINLIIDLINGMISGIVEGINIIIKAANKLSFKAPDWLGGKTYGVHLDTITAPKIPKLATGTVVPANYGEFLAVLGDNKREAEVVSPISAMKQALKEAVQEMGGLGSGELTVNVYLTGKQIHTEVVKQDKDYRSQNGGKSAFAT